MTPIDVAELRRLAEAATPGPVYISGRMADGSVFFGDNHWNVRSNEPSDPERGPHITTSGVHSAEDAAYIVALVNAAPGLLAVVEAAQRLYGESPDARIDDALRAALDALDALGEVRDGR